ncbi:MAG: hypothetical protein ACRDFQ_04875 [Anaerolineales bacterium]
MEQRENWISRNWFYLFLGIWGTFVALPFLAPVFMYFGLEPLGRVMYGIYSFTCHQLPQRSFFLFGSKTMYSLGEIQTAFQNTNNPSLLRQFIGNPEVGWKIAWSDRMVSMYGAIIPAALIWYPLRHRLGPLSIWGLIWFLNPMILDGMSHILSDLAGIGQGFRDTNTWLVALTGNRFSASFYAGDAIGSFNSWMRLLSGVFFAIGVAWFTFPYLNESMGNE